MTTLAEENEMFDKLKDIWEQHSDSWYRDENARRIIVNRSAPVPRGDTITELRKQVTDLQFELGQAIALLDVVARAEIVDVQRTCTTIEVPNKIMGEILDLVMKQEA